MRKLFIGLLAFCLFGCASNYLMVSEGKTSGLSKMWGGEAGICKVTVSGKVPKNLKIQFVGNQCQVVYD